MKTYESTTVADLLPGLENRIRSALLQTPQRRPWIERERNVIIRIARECLGVRDEWIPAIKTELVAENVLDKVTIQMLRSTSWDRCYGAAHLFLPSGMAGTKAPLVILCCGHARGGKQGQSYQLMAWRLAHMGCAVLVPDNIGQGERAPMGHSNVVAPFQCGLSLQGLIVMETAGWLRWAHADNRFDGQRIAAIGNSGGGTLTLFMGAMFRDELAALSSSGYPSSFDFIAAKEKKHCHCNILPGIVGNLEMWQLYGCYAPKPLFLFQGRLDHLFPEDLFDAVCRKVKDAYCRSGANAAFKNAVFPGEHAWDDERRKTLAVFLSENLGFGPECSALPELAEPFGNCYESWPAHALDTDSLALSIAGAGVKPCKELFRVYLPRLEKYPDQEFRRVKSRQLAAQWQAFLSPHMRINNDLNL